jgi:O-antigen ligase
MRRSSIIGIIIASVLILFIYIVKNRQWKRKVANKFFIISILLITVSIPAIILLYTNVSVNPDLLNRKTIDFEFKERMDISRTQLAAAYAGNYQYVPIGRGKAVFLLRDESHNQYVRNFVDTGLIGSLIFLGLIFMIIKRITKTLRDEVDPLRVALATGVFVSTISLLVLSLATEAFLVVRINEAYWYFMGLTMAALTLGRLKQAS